MDMSVPPSQPRIVHFLTVKNSPNRLTQAEQRTLEQRMQKRQVKEFMGAFGGLVEHCFTSCVDDFTSKAVSTRENGCVNRCVLKWMATQQRVSDRFQEHNAQLTQQMQNK
ncbi:protein transporter tim9 [Claviceps aff. purpurea]|uniref:Mitochondrial import inner membrane translocase subunit n=1 Tax=Claviceps aff. purpurea TaxID=1967640 RepID=A0A9P7U4L6_9HYPO|nr:protein transporter tim9 [Claviceps purpurea]KAG6302910.1 protein transporter tim9 [Claviceps aff. purpurea]